MNQIIEQAIKLLKPINYSPAYPAYFVQKNDSDEGGEDYCEKCISIAVKNSRKHHREERKRIIDKFRQINETGFLKHGRRKINVKEKYTTKQIADAKRYELKDYPAQVSFTSTSHDPDFGGGLHEPCTCAECGEPFECSFTPNEEEAGRILDYTQDEQPLTEREKWEIEIGLNHYEYTTEIVQEFLLKAAETIISKSQI